VRGCIHVEKGGRGVEEVVVAGQVEVRLLDAVGQEWDRKIQGDGGQDGDEVGRCGCETGDVEERGDCSDRDGDSG